MDRFKCHACSFECASPASQQFQHCPRCAVVQSPSHVATISPVAAAIKAYEAALREQSNANSIANRAAMNLETAVMRAVVPEDPRPPCADEDAIEVICGDRVVRLQASDNRPNVEIESLARVS